MYIIISLCSSYSHVMSSYSHDTHTFTWLQNELCVAAGPGVDMFDSTRIIGEKQFTKGKVSTCS